MREVQKPKFPLERILTASIVDFFLLNPEKSPADYDAVGVQANGLQFLSEPGPDTGKDSIQHQFANLVPDGTEVVLSYDASVGGVIGDDRYPDGFNVYTAQGTALIPKKNSEQ